MIKPPQAISPEYAFKDACRDLAFLLALVYGLFLLVLVIIALTVEGGATQALELLAPWQLLMPAAAFALWVTSGRSTRRPLTPPKARDILAFQQYARAIGLQNTAQALLNDEDNITWDTLNNAIKRLQAAQIQEAHYALGYTDLPPPHDINAPAHSTGQRPNIPIGPKTSATISSLIAGGIAVILLTNGQAVPASLMALAGAAILIIKRHASNDSPLQDDDARALALYIRRLGLSHQARDLGPVHYSNAKRIIDTLEERAAKAPPPRLHDHLPDQIAWSHTTFGPERRTQGVIKHMRKEMKEVLDAPHDLEEWIDLVLLALDGAWRCQGPDVPLDPHARATQVMDALTAKFAKKQARQWPDWRSLGPDEAVEHDRSDEKNHNPLSGKYGDVLTPFLQMMEAELHANAHKGDRPGWLAMSHPVAMLEIHDHVGKLQKALKDSNLYAMREYAADTANMCMMLLDLCGGLTPKDTP